MQQPRRRDVEDADATVVLGILETVGRNEHVTQRTLAAELGSALGLVNLYLKRCVKKGLIKVREVPPRRFAYYLTPSGLAEKSRLTASFLSQSFDFFRRARGNCHELFKQAEQRGINRVVLLGVGELAEVATLCAIESKVTIVAVIAPGAEQPTFVGVPVLHDLAAAAPTFDAAIVTEMKTPAETYAKAVRVLGNDRVLVPDLLRKAIELGNVGGAQS
jgi:DNA-binding MarR family transcriptional regulator